MKQKYVVEKDTKANQISVKEYAELDREVFSLLCEENYDQKAVETAIETGKNTLMALLRTNNMYPPAIYFDRVCDAVMELCAKSDLTATEIFINDHEMLTNETQVDIDEDLDTDSDDLDELLDDDDFDAESADIEALDDIKAPLKIADDESVDVEDET